MKLCLDVGATNIRSALVIKNKVINKKIQKNPKDLDKIIKSVVDLISSYKDFDCICIALASFVKNNTAINTVNMPIANLNFKKILEKKFNKKVFVENDANCAALGEKKFGKGKNYSTFIFITLGTGIGSGLILNNKLFKGTSFAGEIGQMQINGNKLESIVSGPAFYKFTRIKGYKESNEELINKAKNGNKELKKILDEMGYNLGLSLLNASYVIDPEIIIVGGGFSSAPFIIENASKILKEKDEIKRNIKIIKSSLGDNAGLIGASLLPDYKY